VKFGLIKEHRRTWPAGLICRVLGVSRSGFFAWLKRGISRRRQRRQELAVKIRAVHREHRGVYGSPRVCAALNARGEKVCRHTVAKVMREQEIRARVKKRFAPCTTNGNHRHSVAENVLDRNFTAHKPNRKWAADITYVPTGEGWLYMAAVIDLCSRKIVGWSMAQHMEAELVNDALEMALARRRPEKGLLHHSDRGVQYACDDYQGLLAEHGILCSMSGKGDCWDNAVMESFWATLKTELVYQEPYATREQARASIFEYVEAFYNRKRLHSALGYLSPEMFEASLN
jgi:transposase InsO family protein